MSAEDPLAGTDLAAVVLPEGMVGFGGAEVAALVSRHPGPTAERSAAVLGVDMTTGDDVRRAGMSSLLARRLVEQSKGRFLPRSAAALLDYALGAAERWTTIAISHDEGRDLAVVLHAPEVVALMQPRALGSWFAAFTGSSGEPDTAVAALQDAVRAEHPEASFDVTTEVLGE